MKTILSRFIALIVLLAALPAAAQTIGRVIAATGEVSIVRGGVAQPATAGSTLQAGDTVRTGAAANAQLWFTDTSIVALRASTEFAVQRYRFDSAAAAGSAAFNLVRGGFRTLTGLIGKSLRREDYQVTTRTATVGVRGTHYSLVSCQDDCPMGDGTNAPNGTYGGVYEGRVGVYNNTPEVQFGRDEYFFVADINTIPQPLVGPPSFLADRLAGLAKNAARASNDPPASASVSTTVAAAVNDLTPPAPPTTPYTAPENRTSSGAPDAVEARSPIGVRMAYVTATPGGLAQGGVSGFLLPANYTTTIVNGQPLLSGISGTLDQLIGGGTGTFELIVGSSGADMVGFDLTSGVRWGRWINGQRNIVPSGVPNQTPGTGIHFIYGTQTSDTVLASKTGSFSYSDMGGTTPTLNNGVQATSFNFAPVSIDFTARTASMGSSTIVFPNATVTLSGHSSTSFTLVPGRGGYYDATMSGTCSGSICGNGSVNAFFGGMFFGVNPNHIGVSLGGQLGQPTNGVTFSGVRLFGNPAPFTPPPSTGLVLLTANSLQETGGSVGSYNFAHAVTPSQLTTSGSGPTQLLTGFTLQPGDPFSGSSAGGVIEGAGYDADSGVYYGRWRDGTITQSIGGLLAPGTQTSGMGVHYLYGASTPESVMAAKTGTFQYVDYVGTFPSASNGETGTYTMGPINVNFTARSGNISSVTMTFPSSSWSFSNLPFTYSFSPGQPVTFNNNLPNVGSCVGSACGPIQGSNTARADFFGSFIGPSGTFLGISFQGNSGAGSGSGNPNLTAGLVRLFKCPSCP